MITDKELLEIQREFAVSTRGEWKEEMGRLSPPRPEIWAYLEDGSKVLICHSHTITRNSKSIEDNINWGPDTQFILGSRRHIPRLIEEVKMLKAKVKELGGS